MLRRSLAATFVAAITGITGAAFASTPASGQVGAAEQPATEVLTVLHAVSQWSTDLSTIADKKAKSDLVKNYAHEVATSNANKDAQIMSIAQKHGIDVASPDPQTEEGKTTMLGSLDGDAFDKEYMTLVTNTQQSLIHFLEARKAAVKEQDVKQFMVNLITVVQNRLKTAQKIMATVYGNNI